MTPDTKPGHYYVTVYDRGRYIEALGPFTQQDPRQGAHFRALALVDKVRRYVRQNDHSPHEPWYAYGTCRIDLCESPPLGKLNGVLFL